MSSDILISFFSGALYAAFFILLLHIFIGRTIIPGEKKLIIRRQAVGVYFVSLGAILIGFINNVPTAISIGGGLVMVATWSLIRSLGADGKKNSQ